MTSRASKNRSSQESGLRIHPIVWVVAQVYLTLEIEIHQLEAGTALS